MVPFARACCKSGAHFITSGIIGERRAELLAALEKAGFSVLETRESGDWVAALLRA
jgi:ribosomal protein L11 methyltransferase